MTGKPIRVLLVEDDHEDARLFQAMLVHEVKDEFQLARVGRLAEAWRIYRASRPTTSFCPTWGCRTARDCPPS